MRILVIDDDLICRVQTKSLLSSFGDCDGAPNGRIGLELFKSAHAESHPYNLVALDVDMPEMSGLDVGKELPRWEERTDNCQNGRAVSILMLSALSDGRTAMRSFGAGCELYLVKPLSPAKLTQALEKFGIRPAF